MTTNTIFRGPAVRRASRFRRRLVVLGLLIGAAIVIAVAVGIGVGGPDSGLRILPDLTPLGDALARGELPIELLLIGAGGGLVVGLAITLIVATIRGRHRGAPATAADHPSADTHPADTHPADTHPADTHPADAHPAHVPADSAPSAMTWPTEDAYSYAPSPPASWDTTALEEPPSDSPWFDTHRTDDHALPEVEEARVRLDAVSATEILVPGAAAEASHGVVEAPPVAKARAGQGSLPASHTPLAAALGTVATGAAFAFGAVVGAGVGVTVAAAIGIAFAVGAGAAVAATMLLLRSQGR